MWLQSKRGLTCSACACASATFDCNSATFASRSAVFACCAASFVWCSALVVDAAWNDRPRHQRPLATLPRTHFQLLAWACPRTAWVVATRSSAVFCAVRAAASCSFSSLALCKGKHGHSKMANSTNTEIQPPATTTTTTTPSATRPAAPSACPQPQQRQRAPSPAASIASPPVFTTHTRVSASQPGQGPFTPPPTTTPHACKHTALAVAKLAVSSLTLSSRAAVA